MWKGKCIFINRTLPGWQNTMLKFPASLLLQGLFLGSPLGCLAPSARHAEGEIQHGKGDEEQRGL